MIQGSSFLLALLVSATLAVKLTDEEVIKADMKTQPETDLPDDFPTDDCYDEEPDYMVDPVCFVGQWIEHAWMEDPDFWICGTAPLNIKNPVCNSSTGKWSTYIKYDNASDEYICGPLPHNIGYAVCDHVTSQWREFKPVEAYDF